MLVEPFPSIFDEILHEVKILELLAARQENDIQEVDKALHELGAWPSQDSDLSRSDANKRY